MKIYISQMSRKQVVYLTFCGAFCTLLIFIFYAIWIERINDLLTTIATNPNAAIRQQKIVRLKSLLDISRHIIRAHRYVRTKEALYELNGAFENVNRLLHNAYHDLEQDNNNMTNSNLSEICPEIYMGMRYGWPYYYTGYVFTNCTTNKPLGDLVSVVLNTVDDIEFNDLENVLNGLMKYYPTVPTLIAYHQDHKNQFLSLKQKFTNLSPMSVMINDTDITKQMSGKIWKTLFKNVQTKYTFVGAGMIRFDNYSLFERLLLFSSHLEADAVGGSHRFLDGRWYRGCFSSRMQNYTLKLLDGYDQSYNSCIYCDYISGPFLTKTETLLKYIDQNIKGSASMVFLDFFTNLKTGMVCPDVMTTIKDNHHAIYEQKSEKNVWFSFIKKYSLSQIYLPYGQNPLIFSCTEAEIDCGGKAGFILPVCCLQELTDALKFLAQMAQKYNIFYEIDSATTLGAVKFNGLLPYEGYVADFDWLSNNYTTMQMIVQEFKRNSYQIVEERTDYGKCLHRNDDEIRCGYFEFRSKNWRLKMWSAIYLGSEEANRLGLANRTKILLDGMWVNSVHSPGLTVRNKFGDDIYEHVKDWLTLAI